MAQKRKPKVTKQNGRRKGGKQYVPGWGGMVGRGLGWARKSLTSKGSVANKALRLARKVADMVNVEYKYFDLTSTGNAFSDIGTFGIMNSIPQGNAESQRIGDSVKLQNVTLRYDVKRQTNDCFARIMVIWDKMNSTSAVNDILQSNNNINVTNNPKNYDKRFQTQILYDKIINLNTNHPQQHEEVVIDISQHTQYSAGTTTILTGALKLLYISNDGTGPSYPVLNYYARMTYTDD